MASTAREPAPSRHERQAQGVGTSLTVDRTPTIRILCAFAAALAAVALAAAAPSGAAAGVARWALGGATACVLVGVVLDLVSRATPAARVGIFRYLGIVTLVIVGTTAPPAWVVPVGAVVLVASVLVIVRETGLRVTLDGERIHLRSLIPPRSITLSWAEIEAITVDAMDVDLARWRSPTAEIEARIAVHAGGRSIVIDTPRFEDLSVVHAILERAGPHALRWSLDQIGAHGRVVLGPVELTRDAIRWRVSDARDSPARSSFILPLVITLVGLLGVADLVSTVGALFRPTNTDWPVSLALGVLFTLPGIVFLVKRFTRRAAGWESAALPGATLRIHGSAVCISAGDTLVFVQLAKIPNGVLLPRLVETLSTAQGSAPESPGAEYDIVVDG
jgi:hypothetical protein